MGTRPRYVNCKERYREFGPGIGIIITCKDQDWKELKYSTTYFLRRGYIAQRDTDKRPDRPNRTKQY